MADTCKAESEEIENNIEQKDYCFAVLEKYRKRRDGNGKGGCKISVSHLF